MSLLDLIPAPWGLVAKVALPVLAIGGAWLGGDWHGHSAQSKADKLSIVTLTGQRNGWRQNARDQKASLDRQNAAVQQQADAAEARLKASHDAAAAADKRASSARALVDRLTASAAEKPAPGKECDFSDASKEAWK
jgi:hypothetical protein